MNSSVIGHRETMPVGLIGHLSGVCNGASAERKVELWFNLLIGKALQSVPWRGNPPDFYPQSGPIPF